MSGRFTARPSYFPSAGWYDDWPYFEGDRSVNNRPMERDPFFRDAMTRLRHMDLADRRPATSTFQRPVMSPIKTTPLTNGTTTETRMENSAIEIVDNKEKFMVKMDVSDFRPNELNVKTVDNQLVVEAQHEERPDDFGFVSRHIVRKYQIPEDVEPDKVESNLAAEGILTLEAPKKNAGQAGERKIRIQMGPS